MFIQTAKRLLLVAGLSIATVANLPAGVIVLSGSSQFGTDVNGSWVAGITTTSGCCQFTNVEEGSFTGLAQNYITLPLTLTDGTYTFYLESSPDWTTDYGLTYGGVNLFFDGSGTPGISAVTVPTYDLTDYPGFGVISNAETTAGLNDEAETASGTLTYVGAGGTATLTSLQWVGGGGGNPYSDSLTVQQVEITVSDAGSGSAAAEPGTLLLLGAGLGLLGAMSAKRLRLPL